MQFPLLAPKTSSAPAPFTSLKQPQSAISESQRKIIAAWLGKPISEGMDDLTINNLLLAGIRTGITKDLVLDHFNFVMAHGDTLYIPENITLNNCTVEGSGEIHFPKGTLTTNSKDAVAYADSDNALAYANADGAGAKGATARALTSGSVANANADGAIANATARGARAYSITNGAVANSTASGAKAIAQEDGAVANADAPSAVVSARVSGAIANANGVNSIANAKAEGAVANAHTSAIAIAKVSGAAANANGIHSDEASVVVENGGKKYLGSRATFGDHPLIPPGIVQ